MNRTTSTFIFLVSLLFIISTAQAQDCLDFQSEMIFPCQGQANGEINITNLDGVTGQPPFTFSWSDDPSITDSLRSGLSAGTYTLTITGVNGESTCSEVREFDLVAKDTATINGSVNDASCSTAADGSIGISVTGPGEGSFDLIWSNGGTEKNIGDLSPGTYSVTVTGFDVCPTTASFIVGADPFQVNDSISNATCSYTSDGKIKLTVIGSSEGYLYNWSNGASADSINNLAPGNYSVTVTSTDNENCVLTETYTVGPSPIQPNPNTTDITCVGNDDGAIVMNVSGGNGGYTHIWSNGATGAVLNLLPAGVYTDSIVDGSGCSVITSVVVNEPPLMELNCTAVSADVSQQTNTGSFRVEINEGSSPYTLNWSGQNSGIIGSQNNVQEALLINSLPSDTFYVTVTDANSCVDSCTVFVKEIFRVNEDSDFIIEFNENATKAEIEAFVDSVGEKDGVEQIKICNCDSSAAWLQLWHTRDVLDINTSGQSSSSNPRGDTSGLAFPILIQYEDIPTPTTDLCAHPETASDSGQDSIVIAIIDSGINLREETNDRGHPALINLQRINPLEIPGDKIDNDGNCCIDDHAGFDYLNMDGVVIDSIGHGTHLAGIVADAYPRDINLKIINLKVYDEDDTGKSRGNVFDLVCALHYAINQGAKVINLSLGYFDKEPSKPLYRALKKAEERNVLVVISAGNDSLDLDKYETDSLLNRWPGRFNKNVITPDSILSALKNIIVVAALDPDNNDLDNTYTNYSFSLVDIAANANFYSTHLGASYLGLKGTSMSAAYLSRIFSIVRAHNPDLSVEDIIGSAVKVAIPIPSGSRLISAGKFDERAFLEDLGLGDIITKIEPVPVPDQLFLQPDGTFSSNDQSVNFSLRLGDGKTQYQNVVFEIFKHGTTTSPIYTEHLCLANYLYWNGDHKDGGKSGGGDFQFKVTIGGKIFPKINSTKITIGGAPRE
ncbi:MAG: hypothetical protein DHS20C18_02390 [Saprospiraceae bacterium]|nr:MAG: hypothetical protein DHS20C18_02390 [Saprospiraceae bacterium]